MKRRLLLILSILLAFTLIAAACGDDDDGDTSSGDDSSGDDSSGGDDDGGEDAVTAAFIYIGEPGDAGWTWAHDQGRQAAEAATGATTLTVENIPETGPDFEQAARDVIAVLDDLDLDQCHLVGTSLGGKVALCATNLAPDRVPRLVLLATAAGAPPRGRDGGRGGVGEAVVGPGRHEARELRVTGGRGKDGGSGTLGELNRSHAHAARSGVNEHALAGLQAAEFE